MNTFQWGLVQSIFTVGGFIGALFSGAVATKHGRLFTMKWAAFFLALGPFAMTRAESIRMLAFGRAISGLGAGIATVVAPLYVSEIAPENQRGIFGVFTQVQINIGIVIAQFLGYHLSEHEHWRWILLSSGFIAGIMYFGLMLAPETPKWLAHSNRPRMAKAVLQQLHGNDANAREVIASWDDSGNPEEAEPLLSSSAGVHSQRAENKSIIEVIRTPKYRRAVIAVTGCMMAQQLTGINAVVLYSVAVLQKVIPDKAALVTISVSALNVVATMASSPLPDKIGRKKCLLFSIAGMGAAAAMLQNGLEQQVKELSIAAIALFITSFATGLGPVPYLLTSEFVGAEAAGAVSSWALAGNWFSMFLVAMFFPALDQHIGNNVWWIFVGTSKGKSTPEEVWGASPEE
jgi:sugar porter (SP) family MFS transporter